MVPGRAQEMLRELAPLLAEEGIDVDNIDVPDIETLQRAMNRAVERRNLELFSPVGPAREIATVTLRLVVQAILDGDTALAGAILDQVQPESRAALPDAAGRRHRVDPASDPQRPDVAPHPPVPAARLGPAGSLRATATMITRHRGLGERGPRPGVRPDVGVA